MRRKEKEITDSREIEEILHKAEVCYLSFAKGNTPYVIPVNYGYEDGIIYIHSAREGRKLEMIRGNKQVCFAVHVDAKIYERGDKACRWGTAYRSVIGFGEAYISHSFKQKKHALDVIMNHYSESQSFEYDENAVENVVIIRIEISGMTGKKSSVPKILED